jgi:hypothetical protein
MNNNQQQQEQQQEQQQSDAPVPISDTDVERRKEEQQKRNEWLKEKMELRRKQQIQFIMTQTNYDESEATQKLEACNNDVMKVVGEYLGIGVKEDENVKKTKNQKVFSVIRDIMDSGSRNYIIQQERAKKMEEIKKLIEMKKQREQECDNGNNGNNGNNINVKINKIKEKND